MKVLIVGGGITGLSAAWFLTQRDPTVEITLLEKTNRLGGWIETSREGGFLFEKGPRTFPLGRSPHLLQLLRDLDLPILTAPPQKRYIWHKNRLRALGSFIPRLIPYLLREPFVASGASPDESIYDFAARRFSPRIAETLFDPLALGIYAGDIRKLSVRACFPTLFRWEREKGSLLRGLLTAPKTAKGLFTLSNGMETLIDALQKRLPIDIVLNSPVESIGPHGVIVQGKIWEADRVFVALPPAAPKRSLWVVPLAYPRATLSKTGYGYLVPSQEKQSLLGMVWDSSIFPQQSLHGETRLTAMIRAEEKQPVQTALQAAERHLGISAQPLYASAFYAPHSIPQFEVGCNDFEGISVEACIEKANRWVYHDRYSQSQSATLPSRISNISDGPRCPQKSEGV